MKISISTQNLANALATVTPAVAARSTKPILANVKIVSADDALTLYATDLEIAIRTECRGVDVLRAGAVVVNPVKLAAILRESSDDTVTLDLDGDTCHVRTSTGKYKLATMPADEFPEPTALEGEAFTAQALGELLRKVSYAADKRESGARWAVTGTLLEVKGGKLSLVATDTKRLAMVQADVIMVDGSALLPAKAVAAVEKMPGGVSVVMGKNECSFSVDGTTVQTRLVEGRFPPYGDIIPKKHTVTAGVPGERLLSAVRQASIMADDETKRLDFAFADDAVSLKAEGAETGSSEVNIALDSLNGKVNSAFDPRYLIDFLKGVTGDVEIQMTTGEKPAVFKANGVTYLAMPLAG